MIECLCLVDLRMFYICFDLGGRGMGELQAKPHMELRLMVVTLRGAD